MEVVLRKYGNSTVLPFPPALLKHLGLKAGQLMSLDIAPNGAITLTPKQKYTLEALIAQCDLKAAPPKDLALWDIAKPEGNELW